METKIKETVEEILDVCTKANIVENPENLIHVLIAYFNCPEIKTELEYAINAIIANMIHDITGNIKGDEIKLTTSELQRLCKCIMIKNEKEENKPCTIFKDEVENEPAWSYEIKNNDDIEESEIPRRVVLLNKEVIEI